MAISIIQTGKYDGNTNNSGGSGYYTFTLSAASQLGSTLIVALGSATGDVSAITDSAGNTWTSVVSNTGQGTVASIWTTGPNAKSITTISIHGTGTLISQQQYVVEFYEATKMFAVADKTAGNNNAPPGTPTTSPTSTATATLAGQTDLAIGIVSYSAGSTSPKMSTATFTAGTGTNVDHFNSLARSGFTGYIILNGTSAQTYSGTITASIYYAAVIATFQEMAFESHLLLLKAG